MFISGRKVGVTKGLETSRHMADERNKDAKWLQ